MSPEPFPHAHGRGHRHDQAQHAARDRDHRREEELLERLFEGLDKIPGLRILAENNRKRLAVVSFYFEHIHYNLVVRLLSDRFGIQVRGGCACAGTYGHFLLNVDYEHSRQITEMINTGDLSEKPGWVRLSLHPTMTDAEVDDILNALQEIGKHHKKWEQDYFYNRRQNEYIHKDTPSELSQKVAHWFKLS